MHKVQDKSIEEKQNFLREQILEKDYDPQVFIQLFKEERCEEEVELEYIHFNDLTKLVEKFQSDYETYREIYKERKDEVLTKKSFISLGRKEEKPEMSIIDEDEALKRQSSNISIIKEEGNEKSFDLSFSGSLKCNKQEKNAFYSLESLTLHIEGVEIVKGNFLSSSFSQYEIICYETSTKVKRRYKDFEWLRESLVKLHPEVFIPPIPEKHLFNSLEQDVINKRKRLFSKFLNRIVTNKTLKNTMVLYYFLTEEDSSDYERLKREYKLKTFKQIENLEGLINYKYNKTMSSETMKIEKVIDYQGKIYNKLIDEFDILKEQMEGVSFTLNNISSLYSKIEKSNEFYKLPSKITNYYSSLKDLFSNWSKIYTEQKETIEVEFKEDLLYIDKEFQIFKDRLSVVKTQMKDYENFFNSIKNVNKQNERNMEMLEVKKETFGISITYFLKDFHEFQKYYKRFFKNKVHFMSSNNQLILKDIFGMVHLLNMNSNKVSSELRYESLGDENEEKEEKKENEVVFK